VICPKANQLDFRRIIATLRYVISTPPVRTPKSFSLSKSPFLQQAGFWRCALLVLGLQSSFLFPQSAAQEVLRPNNPNRTTLQLLEQAKQKQLESSKTWTVFHDFQFSDRYEESGIRFEQRVVDDAAKNYKAVHYDHGTGLAAADVDNDGLVDLFFVNQVGGNQLWRNTGHGKFENISAAAGIALEDKVCVGASFGDIDNDGLPDLFVTTVRMGNVLFKNLGGGKFQDITSMAGVGYAGHSSGAVFFDFNGDGLLDLFVCNVGNYTTDEKGAGGYYIASRDAFRRYRNPAFNEPSILYQNLGGGKFKDVSKEMRLQHTGWSGDASFCDVNGDGRPDLYVLSMSGDDKFYENQGGHAFAEKTAAYFPKTPWGAMGIKFCDFNNDGWIDLFVTDMHSDMTTLQTKAGEKEFRPTFAKAKSEQWCSVEWSPEAFRNATNSIFGNAFYQNHGNGKFVEVSDKVGAETYWPWGISVADLNADGYEDVFVTAGMGYPVRYGINSILLNDAGKKFVDSEFVLGAEPPKDNRIEKVYFVLDCDGADKGHPIARGRKGLASVMGSTSSRSSVAFDIDGDGDVDLVTNDFNDHPRVLISNLSEKKPVHFLKIKLAGTTSNRDGLGATVKVHAGARAYTRYHDGKSGYLSQSLMPLYFGLAEAPTADSIEVTWPSGKKQIVSERIPANSLMTITEPR